MIFYIYKLHFFHQLFITIYLKALAMYVNAFSEYLKFNWFVLVYQFTFKMQFLKELQLLKPNLKVVVVLINY